MMIAAIDHRDRNRRAGKREGRLQPAKSGADDHHAMRIFRRWGHGTGPRFRALFASMHSFRGPFQWLFAYQSIADPHRHHGLSGAGATTRRWRAGNRQPASAPHSERIAATVIAAAKPAVKSAGELPPPRAEKVATRRATPNTPPRNLPILKMPEALPISTTATELSTAFWTAGIAIDTPTPARMAGATSAE